MAVKLPQRKFLTFPELQDRWACTENDLRRMVLSALLIPSYLWNDPVNVVTFIEATQDGLAYWEPSQVPNDREFEDEKDRMEFPYKSIFADGFYFLLFPWQTSALNCNFVYLSKDRSVTQQAGQTCLMLKRPKSALTLDDVIESGAVMMSEILLFEGASEAELEKPLSTTERNSLLRLVIGMAIGAYSYSPSSKKSFAPTEICNDLELLGISMTRETVGKYLREAENSVLPVKPGPA